MSAPLTPGRAPEPVTLDGIDTIVTPLDLDRDAASLYAVAHGGDAEKLFRYLPTGPFADVATYRTFLEGWSARPDVICCTLMDRNRVPFGTASLMRLAPSDRCAEIGYIWFAERAQRTRRATEAMYLLARHIFEPSRRAADRLGFTYEGLFRNHMIVKGRNRDTAWFAMIDSDWPAIRAGFERWLSPGNFDAAGNQIATLAACRNGG
jgi:RimJ/RimL family protein N-acetyltransferase